MEVSTFTHFDPDSKTLDALGFTNPRFRLEVEQQDNTKSNILISKSNSETSLWNTYVTDQAFIGLVDTQWNKLLSVNAIDYQDRKLFPAQFRPDQIDLKTIHNSKVISTLTYDAKGEAFERFLGFQAEYFIDLSYNNEGIWVDGDWLPWVFQFALNAQILKISLRSNLILPIESVEPNGMQDQRSLAWYLISPFRSLTN